MRSIADPVRFSNLSINAYKDIVACLKLSRIISGILYRQPQWKQFRFQNAFQNR